MRPIALILFLFTALQLHSQHMNLYSHYVFNSAALNPASIGKSKALDLSLIHRKQWLGFDGAPTSFTVSAHSMIGKTRVGLGLLIQSDSYGISRQSSYSLGYSYSIKFCRSVVSAGLSAGIYTVGNNNTKLITSDATDEILYTQQKFFSGQAGAGVMWRNELTYFGLSIPFIGVNRNIQSHTPPVFLSGAHVFKLNPATHLKASALVKFVLNSPVQFDFDATVYYRSFGFGAGFRTQDAIIGFIQFEINKQMRAGYAYDYCISQLGRFNRGSHEIMLNYVFSYTRNNQSPRFF